MLSPKVASECHLICLTMSPFSLLSLNITSCLWFLVGDVCVIQVEALLGYFETAVQYNKPNPWHNRFHQICHMSSWNINLLYQLNGHTVHTIDGQSLWGRVGPTCCNQQVRLSSLSLSLSSLHRHCGYCRPQGHLKCFLVVIAIYTLLHQMVILDQLAVFMSTIDIIIIITSNVVS